MAMKQQPKKEVDHRASKNRKIKYIVHDKILNFMPSRDNLALMEGRTAVVANLFGKRTAHELLNAETKASKKQALQKMNDAIRLI